MLSENRKLPIGIQDFEKLRSEGFLYVDKTALVYQLAKTGIPYFLSRPRRFGKSLLLSTFEAYYQGKKELFKGLAIEQLEKDWIEYFVLHLDLNAEKYESKAKLEDMLERQLENWEEVYEVPKSNSYSGRFMAVIQGAYRKTGKRVVVLVDEYDKPLLQTFHDKKLQDDFRDTLTAFYTVLKSADAYLQFIFITGVTKFAQVDVFSTLNQLNDISLHFRYETLCGLTLLEIEATFAPELNALSEAKGISHEAVVQRLTQKYDGYHFCQYPKADLYNPFSILKAFDNLSFDSYWFASGTPTFLADMLRETNYDMRNLDGIEVPAAALTDYRVDFSNPIPMIYQSGYLTIKGYDEELELYKLGYPNDEVKYGFLSFMLPFYSPIHGAESPFYIGRFSQELKSGDTDAFMTRLKAFFADFPYQLNEKMERHYQVVFYLVFKLLGQYVQAEVQSARGRADAVVYTSNYIYLFEFKLDGSADEALKQIDTKGYLIPYLADGRQLVKIEASFDAEERNIGEWKIS